jgi:hypothetical protein
MAVNPQKLLPPPSSALVKVGKIKTSKKSENNSTDSTNVIGAIKKELEKIKENLEKIYSLVLDNNKLTEKDLEVKRLSAERLKFAEKEKRLEEKDPEKKDEKDDKSIPKLGIFDRINRFITFTLLGWVAVRLVKYLPKLLEFSKNLLPVMEFFSSLAANFFKGVVDFIDFGYDAYDKVKDFVKGIGGEPFEKAFDDFSSNLNKFVNLAIIAGIAASGGTDFGLGKGAKPGTPSRPGQGGRPRVTTSGGGVAGRPDIRNPLRSGSRVTTSGGGAAGAPNIRSPLRQKPQITGSGGKVLGKMGGKVFGKIPVIGGLVSFIISVLSGEPVGRAAAKAVGFSIGSALGTFVPVPFVGTILGGMLGDIVGGALYDTLVGNKPEKPEVVAKSKGGKVTTRKGKVVGGPTQRKVRRVVRRVVTPPKSTPIAVGKSVGGKEKLKGLFPEPPQGQVGKLMDPYGYTTGTSEKLGQIPFLGPLFNIFGKTLLGDLPNKSDYQKVGMGLGAWINTAINQGKLQGNIVSAFSDGGMIEGFGRSDISGWVEKSVEELVKNKVTEAINELKRNLGLQPISGTEGQFSPGDMGDGTGLYVSSDSPDFWLLATAALFENSNPQGAADVAQAIYNRVAMPGDPWKVNNSIRNTILNPGQFQPVRQYGGYAAWGRIKTKEDAIAFIKSHGKSQSQLESVAAAILDKDKQNAARQFVGPRDSFRSVAYENANNHLADDTEVRRHGHVFGFEPRGATIGAFRAGKLTAAVPTDSISGQVSMKDVQFGNERGNLKQAEELGKNMGLIITSKFRSGSAGYHGVGRAIDFQTPGAPGNRGTPQQMAFAKEIIKRYGNSIKELIYTPLGFGIKNGKQVPLTTWGPISPPWADLPQGHALKNSMNAIHYDHVHVAFKGGGVVGKNIKSIQTQASYDEGQLVAMFIQPIIIERPIPMNSGNKSITFVGGGVNSNNSKSSLFVG